MIPTRSSTSYRSILSTVTRCVTLCSLLATSLARADESFVSPGGNDFNNGLSAQAPFRTLAAAAKSSPAGAHTIRMAQDDYPKSKTTLLAPGVSLVGAGVGKTIICWSARQPPHETKASPEADKIAVHMLNSAFAFREPSIQ